MSRARPGGRGGGAGGRPSSHPRARASVLIGTLGAVLTGDSSGVLGRAPTALAERDGEVDRAEDQQARARRGRGRSAVRGIRPLHYQPPRRSVAQGAVGHAAVGEDAQGGAEDVVRAVDDLGHRRGPTVHNLAPRGGVRRTRRRAGRARRVRRRRSARQRRRHRRSTRTRTAAGRPRRAAPVGTVRTRRPRRSRRRCCRPRCPPRPPRPTYPWAGVRCPERRRRWPGRRDELRGTNGSASPRCSAWVDFFVWVEGIGATVGPPPRPTRRVRDGSPPRKSDSRTGGPPAGRAWSAPGDRAAPQWPGALRFKATRRR